MPQWAGSCWYYLAYLIMGQETRDKGQGLGWERRGIDYWMPVDIYIGGAEHAVLHLLYARFWHKFLYDIGAVPDEEPFQKLKNQGLILGEDGVKMSKSRGNVINPDDVIAKYGADVMRTYEMFMGPFEEAKPWSTESIAGVKRFLGKVWGLQEKAKNASQNSKLKKLLHKTIKGVTEDIENFKFNTAISKLMVAANAMSQEKEIPTAYCLLLATLIAPFAPHIAEELWERLGEKKSVFLSAWPEYDPDLARDEEFEMVIQINGRVRDKIIVSAGLSEDEAKRLALESEKIKQWISSGKIKKIIFTGKLVNIVM